MLCKCAMLGWINVKISFHPFVERRRRFETETFQLNLHHHHHDALLRRHHYCVTITIIFNSQQSTIAVLCSVQSSYPDLGVNQIQSRWKSEESGSQATFVSTLEKLSERAVALVKFNHNILQSARVCSFRSFILLFCIAEYTYYFVRSILALLLLSWVSALLFFSFQLFSLVLQSNKKLLNGEILLQKFWAIRAAGGVEFILLFRSHRCSSTHNVIWEKVNNENLKALWSFCAC